MFIIVLRHILRLLLLRLVLTSMKDRGRSIFDPRLGPEQRYRTSDLDKTNSMTLV
jgi:hypothetical protein